MNETFQGHLLRQASDATGVNIFDLRQSSNAETQTSRVNTMLRPTQFTDESFETFHQGSNPIQVTESFETFHQGSNPTQFADESFETVHQGSKPTQFFKIREDVNTSAATADYEYRIERQRVSAEYAVRQQQTRAQ